jgi:hypothetical protein
MATQVVYTLLIAWMASVVVFQVGSRLSM